MPCESGWLRAYSEFLEQDEVIISSGYYLRYPLNALLQ